MAVLAAGYLGLCAFALHHSTIWQETFVLGVNVGGMSEEEATQAVSDALSEMADLPLPLSGWRGNAGHRRTDSGCPDPAVRSGRARLTSPLWSRAPTPPSGRAPSSRRMAVSGRPQACPTPEIRKTFRWTPPRLTAAGGHCPPRFPGRRRTTSCTVDGGFPGGHPGKHSRTVDAAALTEQLVQGAWNPELTLCVPYTTTAAVTLTAQEIHDSVAGVVKNAGL